MQFWQWPGCTSRSSADRAIKLPVGATRWQQGGWDRPHRRPGSAKVSSPATAAPLQIAKVSVYARTVNAPVLLHCSSIKTGPTPDRYIQLCRAHSLHTAREPVGLAVKSSLASRRTSVRVRFPRRLSVLFKGCVVYGHCPHVLPQLMKH